MSATTPKQEKKVIPTPFGDATVHDWRLGGDPATRASINFDALTVNRVDYGSVSLYLMHRSHGTHVSPYSYGTLTDSAHKKLNDFFCPGDAVHPELDVYMHPVDAGDIRAKLKHDVAYATLTVLSDFESGSKFRESKVDHSDMNLILDEVLADIIKGRAEHQTFYQLRSRNLA